MFRRLGALIGYLSDTRRGTWTAVVFSGIALSGCEFFVHEITTHSGLPVLEAGVLDSMLLGFSGGTVVWLVLVGTRNRRARVRHELKRIAELNHEIRNALQVISHSHFDAEPQHQAMVLDSVQRIDGVLRRLFPVVGGRVPD